MAAIGNVLWFVFGGEVLALVWLIISGLFYLTIIGAPIGKACLEFAKLSAFPFGKEIIRETELKGEQNVPKWKRVISTILNIFWFVIGITMTAVYFVLGILSFITIIGIPVGIVYIRMGKFLLFPFGARVVSKKQAYASAAANEIERRSKMK
jgi:uncharacterized membrane protein YccF (DUF307 family)